MSKTSYNDNLGKLNKIVELLLDRRVVPFVGAGVSFGVSHDSIPKLTVTSEMARRLAENICKLRYSTDGKDSNWGKWCCSVSECDNLALEQDECLARMQGLKKGDEKCRLTDNSFDKLCEMNIWPDNMDGKSKLINNVLQIPEFRNVNPAEAHRYIAFLAREGLIDEIITTNYDTAIEKAFRDTHGLKDSVSDNEKDPARVIVNLHDYRINAGKVFTSINGYKSRCLRIYKINGCSNKSLNGEPSGVDSILLTESQLQDWRHRSWARDLFRDRLRSRMLLFSGFGSNEPQVRHTALQVVEEFQTIPKKNTNPEESISEWWVLPNAPFMHEFEDKLSFNQLQILQAFAKSHSDDPSFDDIRRLSFTGEDASFFNINGNELSADVFWRHVFQATFWKQLKQYCMPGSAAFAYMSAVVPATKSLLSNVADWFAPDDKIFGRFPELLSLKTSSGDNIPFCNWVWSIRYAPRKMQPWWYTSLEQRPVLIPIFFLVLYLILAVNANAATWNDIDKRVQVHNGFLYVETRSKDGSDYDNLGIIISHPDLSFKNDEEILLPNYPVKNSIIQLLIGKKAVNAEGRIFIKAVESKDGGTIKTIRKIPVYKISLLKYLSSSGLASKDANTISKDFVAKLRLVSVYTDSARSRYKSRVKKL